MKGLSIITLALLLSGCATVGSSSGIQNRDKAYLKAKSIPPLRVPAGLNTAQFENHYPVSDRVDPDSSKTPSVKPPGA